MKVAVLMGGKSAEREVSLMSGARVLQALRARGVDAQAFDPAERDLCEIEREGFARCFIALHGRGGEDGTVQGALEVMGIPYTGSNVLGSALALDNKWRTKMVWLARSLPTSRYRVLVEREDWDAVARDLGLPLIVKPANEGSTLGLTKVTAVAQLPGAYELAAKKYRDTALAESFIAGAEYTVGILDDTALPLIRIEAPQGTTTTSTVLQRRHESSPAVPASEEGRCRALSLELSACWAAPAGAAWTHARPAGDPWLLEVNTSPGMTDHSLVPMAARAAGLSYEDLCVKILEGAHVG
jgi:D-alanine-D-alanine ligase